MQSRRSGSRRARKPGLWLGMGCQDGAILGHSSASYIADTSDKLQSVALTYAENKALSSHFKIIGGILGLIS